MFEPAPQRATSRLDHLAGVARFADGADEIHLMRTAERACFLVRVKVTLDLGESLPRFAASDC